MMQFIANINDINIKKEFVAIINQVDSKESLFNEIKNKLFFPNYFGNNWDALYDCLCDLSWISKSKVCLLHKGLPKIDDKSLVIYLNILVDVITVWESNNNKTFEVIFEKKDEKIIEELLNN